MMDKLKILKRFYSLSPQSNSLKLRGSLKNITTDSPAPLPARTRFAPSPTGFLHLGSLRTALFNYLLAKSTGGQFLLRLEDTDSTRLVPGAEQNLYDTLKWCNLIPDEGPFTGGPYGPYIQSQRKDIYQKYVQILLDKGLAYRCTCTKERLNDLRESAMKLKPPTTVTYDRKCLHEPQTSGGVIRFRSPGVYPGFLDLLHGKLNLQPQYNSQDRRYDDFVIMKSDGLPTYHFASVVDDRLMKITHVIRGEEWLPSTPKHLALYAAFGWEAPTYTHIPLLTSLGDKKLSKRQNDADIWSLKDKGILPEALVNFVALFGWSPPRDTPGESVSEVLNLDQLISLFSLKNLTKGNAKVNDSKLYYFNKAFLNQMVNYPEKLAKIVDENFPRFQKYILERGDLHAESLDKAFYAKLVKALAPNLNTLVEIETVHTYFFGELDLSTVKKIPKNAGSVLNEIQLEKPLDEEISHVLDKHADLSKKDVFQALRYALAGGVPGLTIPLMIEVMGKEKAQQRLKAAREYLNQ